MTIRARAYSRAGLLGNPSDGYHGKALAMSVRNFSACVELDESERLEIRPQRVDALSFDGPDELISGVAEHGYYGGVRLIKAALKLFVEHCRDNGIELPRRNFAIGYSSDIPLRLGLAGSSAIVTTTLRALCEFYRVEIGRERLPGLILRVERDELGIGAGLMDRVIQVYEGLVFMDLGREPLERQGYGEYQPLDPAALPPLFLAYAPRLAKGSEQVHNPLRQRYERRDPQMLDKIERLAALAAQGRDLLLSGRGAELGPLMDRNFDLRAALYAIGEQHLELVRAGRGLGAHINFAGSGGAVIGAYDGDPQRLERLRQAYAALEATLIVPRAQG